MKIAPANWRKVSGAMRPLDIAAIVLVVLVIGVLVFAMSGRVGERMKRAQCRANLALIAKALKAYTDDYKGLLPDCSPANSRMYGPVWPWDVNTNVVNYLEAHGVTRKNLYCPANPSMNDVAHWDFFKRDRGTSRVIGYGMPFKGVRQVPSQLWQTKLVPADAKAPSQDVLVFDATAAQGGSFESIQGLVVDRSNHMRGKVPLGGNLLFNDLHIEWRDYNKMQVRLRTVAANGPVEWSF